MNKMRLFVLVCLFLLVQGCGGAQKGNPNDCDVELQQINNGDYCDVVLAEQLESKVAKFRRNCQKEAAQNKDFLTEKLTTTRECADKKRALDLLRQRCARDFEEIALSINCVGKECGSVKKTIEDVLSTCNTPELEGVYEEKAKVLFARLNERKKDARRLGSLISLSDACIQAEEKVNDRNAKEVLSGTIRNIKKRGRTKVSATPGSEFEIVRAMAFSSCEQTLLATLDIIIQKYAAQLSNPRVKENKRKWKRLYRKLMSIRVQLNKINAASFFPLPLELVEETINQFASGP